MRDYGKFAATIRQIALAAVTASKPVAVMYGTVTNTAPLNIQVEQKITLDKDFLVLTATVQDTPLQVGDKVVLLREQGGQRFVVLDKVV